MKRKVVSTFGPPQPTTHWEIEYKAPGEKKWLPWLDPHGIEWGLASAHQFACKEDADRRARELSEGYRRYSTRVIEVVTP